MGPSIAGKGMTQTMTGKKAIVDPAIYSKEYFLTDNEGWREYVSGLAAGIHTKFAKALELAGPLEGASILDIGCGRGELLYYCAKRGARALGIDYSRAAVEIARQTIETLPSDRRPFARAEVGDPSTYDFKETFTVVFVIEALEHMHDWQLEDALARIRGILAEGGRLIIITPNYYYEKYLSPLKRILNLPLNLFKLPFRLLKPKYRAAGMSALLGKTFKVRIDRGELNRAMHVNVTTPAKVRRLLAGFDAVVRCEDPSRNIVSLFMKRWWGRDIIAVARKRG